MHPITKWQLTISFKEPSVTMLGSWMHGREVGSVGRVVPHVAPDLSIDHEEGVHQGNYYIEQEHCTALRTRPHSGSHWQLRLYRVNNCITHLHNMCILIKLGHRDLGCVFFSWLPEGSTAQVINLTSFYCYSSISNFTSIVTLFIVY